MVDTEIIDYLALVIDSFYGKIVVILPPLPGNSGRYNADSLLTELDKIAGNTYSAITGVTHGSLYEKKLLNVDIEYLKPVLGLALLPGRASVVSDDRLVPASGNVVKDRLKKILFHEMGHNLGLQHCPERHCLMSAANGHPSVLHEVGNNYCADCRKQLNW